MKRNRRRLPIPQHEFGFNAESRIMPSKTRKALIQKGFVDFYSALFCQGSARRLRGLLRRRALQNSEFLENASCSQPAWPHNLEHSFMRVVRIMPSRRDEKGGDPPRFLRNHPLELGIIRDSALKP
jgi:hypothetical protein